jgi:hypothetical protein
MTNAYLLYKKANEGRRDPYIIKSSLEFRREIACTYLKLYGTPRNAPPASTSRSSSIPGEVPTMV